MVRVSAVAFSIGSILVLLLISEGALRFAGYGGFTPTFRIAGSFPGGTRLVYTDPEGPSSYFFASRSPGGSLDPTALLSPKPTGVYRIMVVGGSAAKGNPYSRALNWSAMLRAMLNEVVRDREIEVVNLASTAIASFPVLDMLVEALEYEPDLVIVYVGNNEFYGAYGVTSLHSAGRSPAMIRFVRWSRSLAVVQALDDLRAPASGDPGKTLMELMIGRSDIGPDDPMRAQAAVNLETFVGEMVGRCRARGVPVIVCTPPANERGLAPLGTEELTGLDEAARTVVERSLGEARNALPSDTVRAAAAARRVLALAPDHALAHHLLGQSLHLESRFDQSASEFRLALDLDPMPWRPPSKSVAAIRRAAEGGGAAVCDLELAFRQASPGGSVGWELMDDHVHPSAHGQYLIAASLVRTIADLEAGLTIDAASSERIPDEPTLAARLGDNPYDRFAAAVAMRRLACIPFFRRTNPGFFERFDGLCRDIESRADVVVREQLRLWQESGGHSAATRPISGLVGYALFRANRVEEAEPLFRVAAETVTPYGSWEFEYRYMSLLCRRLVRSAVTEADRLEAITVLNRASSVLSMGQSSTGAIELYVGLLHQHLGDYAASIEPLERACGRLGGRNRLAPDEALAEAYVRQGRGSEAEALIAARIGADDEWTEEYRRIAQRVLGRR